MRRLIFGEATRHIWLRRNALIFRQEECDTVNLYWKIILTVRNFEESFDVLRFSSSAVREVIARWIPPAKGWVKCNVDGSRKTTELRRVLVVSSVILRAVGSRASSEFGQS